MSMIIDNSADKSNFAPDVKLDTEREYDARIVGLIHIGLVQNQNFDDKDKMDEIEQAIIVFELTEEDTFVPRGGTEEDPIMKPRTMPKFIKYSSHEKSGLFALAKVANSKAAWIDGKKGMIDPSMILDQPVVLKIKDGKEDKQNIDKISSYPAKFKDAVGARTTPLFLYDVHTGAHSDTTIEDVPAWILTYAMSKALDVEQFGQLDFIEAHLAALEAEKTSEKLAGDEKPKDTKGKTDAAAAAKVAKAAAEAAKLAAAKAAASATTEEPSVPARRSRRDAAPTPEVIDYSGKDEVELEGLLLAAGKTNAFLDTLSGSVGSDAEYVAALIAELQAI